MAAATGTAAERQATVLVLLRQQRRQQRRRAAGVPAPASEPGTPLPEKTDLTLVVCSGSTSGGEGNFCPLAWMSASVRPA